MGYSAETSKGLNVLWLLCWLSNGPSFFWEKEHGGLKAQKYVSYILPLVLAFVRSQEEELLFHQDNAPSHRAHAK